MSNGLWAAEIHSDEEIGINLTDKELCVNFSISSSILSAMFLFFIPQLLNILNLDSFPYLISLTDIYN